MRALLCLAVMALSGCWKRDTVVQPKLSFEVRGDAGPLAGAKVRLMTITDPYHQRAAINDVRTDENGRASFDEKRERIWVFPLMMHGVTFYSWEWCVEAEGFAARVVAERDANGGVREIGLMPATSPETCIDTDSGLVVKQR